MERKTYPDLSLDLFAIDDQLLVGEFNTDGRLRIESKFVASEAQQKVALHRVKRKIMPDVQATRRYLSNRAVTY